MGAQYSAKNKFKLWEKSIIVNEIYINDELFRRYYYGKIATRYFGSINGKIYSEISNNLMKFRKNKKGYYRVGIALDMQKVKMLSVHRIIATIYHQDTYKNEYDVNHINGIKTDNRIENLEWVSRRENIQHAFDNKLKFGIKGNKNPITKYSDEIMVEAFKLLLNGEKLIKVSKLTGIPVGYLSNLKHGHVKRSIISSLL